MYMHLPDRSSSQTQFRCPSASLVLDVRGTGNNELLKQVEVAVLDLADAMNTAQEPYWSYLPYMLSFEPVDLLSTKEQANILTPQPARKSDPQSLGATGNMEQENSGEARRATDGFLHNIARLCKKIDDLRTEAIAAVEQVPFGENRRASKNPTVHVILLTDAQRPDSLGTAALYAAHLKEYADRQNRDYQRLVYTTVICLGCSSERTLSAKLIRGLYGEHDWRHIDTLFLGEKYRQDAAAIVGAVQSEVAELLLYMLLTVLPRTRDSLQDAVIDSENGHQEREQWGSLPYHTYVVGLATMEYPARWGRRYLNYSLVAQAIEVLQNDIPENTPLERSQIKCKVNAWFDRWRHKIQADLSALPGSEKEMAVLAGIGDVAKPAAEVFTSNRFTPSLGATSLTELQNYYTNLDRTYMLRNNAQQTMGHADEQGDRPLYTLHDLVAISPGIPQLLSQLEELNTHNNAVGNTVGVALGEARGILIDSTMLESACGAFPRALMQLTELRDTIATLQDKHERDIPNVEHMQRELERSYKEESHKLKQHREKWPQLGANPILKRLMAVATIVLALIWFLPSAFLVFAWLHMLVSRTTSGSNPLLSASATVITFWIVMILLVPACLFAFGRFLLRRGTTALAVEACFLSLLLLSCLTGLLVVFFAASLATDQVGSLLISLLGLLYAVSAAMLIVWVIIVVSEVILSLGWFKDLLKMREHSVKVLQQKHQENASKVASFIGDEVTLHLLKRAELTDGNGGTGACYDRIQRLSKFVLNKVGPKACEVMEVASERLEGSADSQMQGYAAREHGNGSRLHLREKYLNRIALHAGEERLRQRLTRDHPDMREFAKVLLLIMSGERPTASEIGRLCQRLFEEHLSEKRSHLRGLNQRQHDEQMLIELCVAMMLRLVVDTSAAGNASAFSELEKQYDLSCISGLDKLIPLLHDTMNDQSLTPAKISQRSLSNDEIEMVTSMLAIWGQTLWQGNKDADLNALLFEDNIVTRLTEQGYKPMNILNHLLARVSPSGGSPQDGDPQYILLINSNTTEGTRFLEQIRGYGTQITSIPSPDVEQVMLCCIQRREAALVPLTDSSRRLKLQTASSSQAV